MTPTDLINKLKEEGDFVDTGVVKPDVFFVIRKERFEEIEKEVSK